MIDSEVIDQLLPQTQCQECGYNGCKPYAEALAKGEAEIDLCPPGGVEVLVSLAEILNKDPEPFKDNVKQNTRPPAVAKIKESECIGCTKCIQACPVDAIIGSNKQMHTVFAADCTGCRLCVEPCPVDCIEVIELAQPKFDKALARYHFESRNKRLNQQQQAKRDSYIEKRTLNQADDKKAKQAYILEALKKKMANKGKS